MKVTVQLPGERTPLFREIEQRTLAQLRNVVAHPESLSKTELKIEMVQYVLQHRHEFREIVEID